MDMKQHLLLMAEYNIWATDRLCGSLETVSDTDFYQDVGLFFKSIFGTLNHLLLGEHYIWYPRFAEGISPSLQLSDIIAENRAECLKQLQTKASNWTVFIEGLTNTQLEEQLHYRRGNGEALSLPFMATLLHIFNHATHHRGQVSAAITALGYTCPVLDLVNMLVEQQKV